MVIGTQYDQIAEKYGILSTTEFGSLAWEEEDFSEDYWYQLKGILYQTCEWALGNQGMRIINNNATMVEGLVSSKYIKPSVSALPNQETMCRATFEVNTSDAGAYIIGLMTGMGVDTVNDLITAKASVCFDLSTSKLYLTVSDDEDGTFGTVAHSDTPGTSSVLRASSTVGAYDNTKKNVIEIRLRLSRSSAPFSYVAADLLINGIFVKTLLRMKDSTYDLLSFFNSEARPYVYLKAEKEMTLEYVGVVSN